MSDKWRPVAGPDGERKPQKGGDMYDAKTFKTAFRGFEKGEVLEFLDKKDKEAQEVRERMEKEIRLRDKAINELKNRLTRKEDELERLRQEVEKKYKPYITNYEQIGELVYESRIKSEKVISEAREEAERIVAKGRETADKAMEDAESRAKKRTEAAETVVAEKVAEGKRKYIQVQNEMNTIIDIINQAQRQFIKSYKEIHETIQNVPNKLYESELMERIEKEAAEAMAGQPEPKPVDSASDADEDFALLDDDFDLFVSRIRQEGGGTGKVSE